MEMKTKWLGFVSLFVLILTTLWIVLLIVDQVNAGPLETFEQLLTHVASLNTVFYLAYINAALITLGDTILGVGLYLYCKRAHPTWSLVGLVFVPVYCTMNLTVYLSQITLIPYLLELRGVAGYQTMAEMILRLTISQWQVSAMAFFNGLAYALFGIPSLIFGFILVQSGRSVMKVGGGIFALSGTASLLGVIGFLAQSEILGKGVLVGGILFLFSLVFLSIAFLQKEPQESSMCEVG